MTMLLPVHLMKINNLKLGKYITKWPSCYLYIWYSSTTTRLEWIMRKRPKEQKWITIGNTQEPPYYITPVGCLHQQLTTYMRQLHIISHQLKIPYQVWSPAYYLQIPTFKLKSNGDIQITTTANCSQRSSTHKINKVAIWKGTYMHHW